MQPTIGRVGDLTFLNADPAQHCGAVQRLVPASQAKVAVRSLLAFSTLRYCCGMDILPNSKATSLTGIAAAADTDIYVVAAHPAWRESRVNRLMLQTAQTLQRAQVCDLYSSYPDYAIDVAKEQAALAKARLIVLLHPIQWYSMPALLKLWFDDVLTYGWAYGEGGASGGRALQGKDLWLVATTGGPEASYHPEGYNRYFFDAFLPPYEQSAATCGMRFLPPLVLHAARTASSDMVSDHVETFRQRLQSYPDWPEIDELDACPTCSVPLRDRPPENPVDLAVFNAVPTRPSMASPPDAAFAVVQVAQP